jgi:iron(III) transport system permease protein
VPWRAAVDSLGASGLAAAVAVLAAVPVAVLALRYPSRSSRLLERLSYAGNALPGLVIALSLVFFAARYASFVYQTLALLVFAYVVRFYPQALSGAESALQRVSPRYEEAARGLGRGPLQTLMLVTAPLTRSGLLAGAALVFLSTMKELPATLLLRPIGFETLATDIWKLTQVGAYSRAAVPALVLIALSAPVLYLVSAERRFEGGAAG